jgi:phosphoribosylanthranilate isomerase
VTIEKASAIAAAVPPFVTVVGLFVDEQRAQVEATLASVALDLLQFHGEESAQYCAGFSRPWIKALRVRDGIDIAQACAPYAQARGVLLDSFRAGVPGGTGQTFDWSLVPSALPLPLVLAGGLEACNVGNAIRQVKPAAVDVSGGVEIEPGLKDRRKIEEFVAAVRNADREARVGT